MDYINIPLKDEELKSLDDYFGYKHARINILADMNPRKIKQLDKDGWNMDISSSDLEDLIKDFVNIYGVIYNKGSRISSGTLYRGTTKREVESLFKGSNNSNILSTTLKEDIAKMFGEYGNSAIIRIKTDEGLPYLYVEDYKDENVRNEEEVLILPFSKVREVNHVSDWNGYSYYSEELEKEELEDLESKELEQIKSECIEKFEEYIKNVKEYNELYDKGENLYYRISRKGIEKDELKELFKKQDENYKKKNQVSQSISEYKAKFDKMLKGLCKEREKEIDKQKREILEQRRIELKEKEKARLDILGEKISELEVQIGQEVLDIREELQRYYDEISDNSNNLQRIKKDLGVQITDNRNEEREILLKINEAKERLEKLNEDFGKEENLDIQYDRLQEQKNQLDEVRQLLSYMPGVIKEYGVEGIQDIKSSLNDKVQDLIYREEYCILQNERNAVEQEKGNVFQRLFTKNSLKKAKLDNIDARMRLEERRKATRNPENRVRIMLQGIYDCAYKNYGGNLTPEMANMVNAIQRNFDKIPQDQELRRNAQVNAQGKFMVVKEDRKFSLFGRSETKKIQEETQTIENQDRHMKTEKNNFQSNTAIFKIHAQINRIYNKLFENRFTIQDIDKEQVWR